MSLVPCAKSTLLPTVSFTFPDDQQPPQIFKPVLEPSGCLTPLNNEDMAPGAEVPAVQRCTAVGVERVYFAVPWVPAGAVQRQFVAVVELYCPVY